MPTLIRWSGLCALLFPPGSPTLCVPWLHSPPCHCYVREPTALALPLPISPPYLSQVHLILTYQGLLNYAVRSSQVSGEGRDAYWPLFWFPSYVGFENIAISAESVVASTVACITTASNKPLC